MQRIAVIGNSGGGKTRLSRSLSARYSLPLTHVDSIQFVEGFRVRKHSESIAELLEIQATPAWIIDGYGPLDILIERLQAADKIIFIDLPIWLHAFWLLKRQLQNIFSPRKELPQNCNELTISHTIKLFKTLKNVHLQMRPEMLKILGKENLKNKVIYICSVKELNRAHSEGVS